LCRITDAKEQRAQTIKALNKVEEELSKKKAANKVRELQKTSFLENTTSRTLTVQIKIQM
jgi:hypothetical protein